MKRARHQQRSPATHKHQLEIHSYLAYMCFQKLKLEHRGTQWRLFMTLHIPALVIVKKVAAFNRGLFYLNVDRVIDKNHLSNKNSLGFKQKQPRV